MSTMVVTPPAAAARVAEREALPLGAARLVDVHVRVDQPGQQDLVVAERDPSRPRWQPPSDGLDRHHAGRRARSTVAGRSTPSSSAVPVIARSARAPRSAPSAGRGRRAPRASTPGQRGRLLRRSPHRSARRGSTKPASARAVAGSSRTTAAGCRPGSPRSRPTAPRPGRSGRTGRWPGTAWAAGPGAGPSPGRARAPGSGRPAGSAAPSRPGPASADPTGSRLRRAVGDRDAGAGRGQQHHVLRVVGDRVVHRLVGGRDAERRGVVVGAEVQPVAAAVGGVDQPGDGRRAVRRRAPPAAVSTCTSKRSRAGRPARTPPPAARRPRPSRAPARPRSPWAASAGTRPAAARRRARRPAPGRACAARGTGWPPRGT